MDNPRLEKSAASLWPELADLEPATQARILRLGLKLGVMGAATKSEEAAPMHPAPRNEVGAKTPSERSLPELDLLLRQLLQAGASWARVQELAQNLYALEPSAASAAHCLELALVHGDERAGVGAAAYWAEREPRFFALLKPELRHILVLRCWQARQHQTLQTLLKGADWSRSPIEELYEFWQLYAGPSPLAALSFYEKVEPRLEQAVQAYGHTLGLELSRFHWLVGKLAFDCDHELLGRAVLERIPLHAPEYQQALQLLLRLEVVRDAAGLCVFARRLTREPEWQRRVALFYEFLGEARRLGGIRDAQRPALNELLRSPLAWVPSQADAWRAVSDMLVEHAELSPLLPHLMTCWEENAGRIHSPDLEEALWGPLLKLQSKDLSRDLYWQGVAHLHRYLWEGPTQEQSLWEALARIVKSQEQASRPPPSDWRNLQRVALAWVAKATTLSEDRRALMLRQLRVAVDPESLSANDVRDYLSAALQTPYLILERLQAILRVKDLKDLELRVILRKGLSAHLTNADLARLWQLSIQLDLHDLAWRVATIIQGRGVLLPQVQHAWAISGEKRNDYSLLPISMEAMAHALGSVATEEQRFVNALLRVGPKIPELLALLDPHVRTQKNSVPSALDTHVEKGLERLAWLAKPKHQYRYSFDSYHDDTFQSPLFQTALPQNTWSLLVVRLANRLGVSSWHGSLEYLRDKIEALIPRAIPGSGYTASATRLGQWLKQLSPEERIAWADLAALSSRLSAERAYNLCAALLLRGATMIYQNHYQALQTLVTIQAPVQMLWDLENWLLSSEYSTLREQVNTVNRVPVPLALQKLGNVIA